MKLFRENFFQDCGEVVDVRLASDEDGKFKGFGHVEFATAEAAQSVSSWHLFIFVDLIETLIDCFQVIFFWILVLYMFI